MYIKWIFIVQNVRHHLVNCALASLRLAMSEGMVDSKFRVVQLFTCDFTKYLIYRHQFMVNDVPSCYEFLPFRIAND